MYARNYRRRTGQRGPVGRAPGQGERNKRTKLKRRKHPEVSKGWRDQGAGGARDTKWFMRLGPHAVKGHPDAEWEPATDCKRPRTESKEPRPPWPVGAARMTR